MRCFASTGEASAPEDYHWLMAQAGYKPVLELCGGTELGGAFISGSLLQPQAPSTFSTPTLGKTQADAAPCTAATGSARHVTRLIGAEQCCTLSSPPMDGF